MNSFLSILLPAIGGIMLWSFAEYAMHHWVGHLGKGKNDFSREHLQHHALVDYFAPNWKKLAHALAVLMVTTPLTIMALGVLSGSVLSVSFVTTYLGYEWLHARAHTHAPLNSYGAWVRKHHFSHHFNNPKHNHGVTSPLWDIVFGTMRPVETVRVPRKHATKLQWLIDQTNGQIRPEFAQDYVLVGRQK